MANLKKLEKMFNGMNLKEIPLHHVCEASIEGKHQRTYFPKDEATGLPNFWSLCIAMCVD
jgi:hypothetical protein